jgi:hypothetical protein
LNYVIGTFSSQTASPITETYTYTLVTGTGSGDNGSFNISGTQLRSSESFNFESKSSYSIRVRSTNSLGQFFETTFTVNITNVNETPASISLSNNSINENLGGNVLVGYFSTTDPDASNTFTYSLVAGNHSDDNGAFSISGNELRSINNLNYESDNEFWIRIRSTDQGGLYVEAEFTIYVNNVNESPTNISLSNSSVNENLSSLTTVGTFSTTDPDDGNTFTYSFASGGADNGSFVISGSDLLTNETFNYEAKSSYSIRIRSTDQGGLYYEKDFTITINNVNESPTDISLSNSSQNENTAINTTIGTFSTTDPDGGNTFTYTLVEGTGSGDNGSFNISGDALRNSAVFDYETKSSYSIRVRSTDQGGLFTEKQFTITVNDVAEPTYGIVSDLYTVAEGQTITLTVTTTNIPNGTSLGWYVGYNGTTSSADFSSATNGNVTINSNTGTFTLTIASDGLSEGNESFFVVLNTIGGSAAATTTDITILSYPVFTLGTTQPNCVTNGTSTTGKLLITGGNPGDIYRYCASSTFTCTNNGCTVPDGTLDGSGNATIDTNYINGQGNVQYTVRVYNASPNCDTNVYTDHTVTLNESICITATISSTNISCNGGSTGSITVTNVTGGSGGPFQTKLNSIYTTYTNWTSSTTYSNLPAGNYTIFIKDSTGKVEEYTRTLTEPTALGIFAQKTGFDQIYAQVSGGASGSKTFELYRDFDAPYEIGGGSLVDTLYDSSSVTFNSVAAGYYYVKVTDSNGCTETTAYIITM